MKKSKNVVKVFIDKIKKETSKRGIKTRLKNKKYVIVQGSNISGYFDYGDKYEIVCTINKSMNKWLSSLVHEFSHYEQWRDSVYAWTASFIGEDDASTLFFDWIDKKKEFSKNKISEIIRKTKIAEIDCDKRSVKNIKKYKLPLDISTYIQKANSYILFHNYAGIRRKWWKKNHAPYELKEVYSQFPKRFLKNYTKIAQKYVDLFDQYC